MSGDDDKIADCSLLEDKNLANCLDETSGSEEMRKLIECPVCLEIPLPPIYLCERGHIVCTECQERTPSCPLCRGYYCKTRSFVAEGIVEKCNLKCKHAEQGCTVVTKGIDLMHHMATCDYRPVLCVDCNHQDSLIQYKDYMDHLIQNHKINGVHENNGFVLYNMDLTRKIQDGIRYCWPPYYFVDLDHNTFLIRMHVSNSFVCAWVSYLGPKDKCQQFQVKIEFHVPRTCLERNKRRFSLIWKGEVNHFREDCYKDIFQFGLGLIIPSETVRQVGKVSDVISEWMYHVEIIDIQKTQVAGKSPRTSGAVGGKKETSSRSKSNKSTEKIPSSSSSSTNNNNNTDNEQSTIPDDSSPVPQNINVTSTPEVKSSTA